MASRLVIRAATAVAGVTAAAFWFVPSRAQVAGAGVLDALNRYQHGDFEAAIQAPEVRRLRAADLIAAADAWTAAGPDAGRARRRIVAAAFAIDLTWSTTQDPSLNDLPWSDPDGTLGRVVINSQRPPQDRSPSPIYFWNAIDPVVRWAVRTMQEAGVGAAIDGAWWPAAAGLLQHGKFWTLALTVVPDARLRAPNNRWRLIDTVARTNHDVPPPRTIGRPNVLFEEGIGTAALQHAPQAIAEFDRLRDDPMLASEADLRAGYLEMRRRHWAESLARFGRARSQTTDPFITAAASYFEGWVHERMHHAPEATAAYRRADGLVPGTRNVSTLLAAQLFMTDARAEAYAILDRGLHAEPAPLDLLLVLERGDARFVPMYLHDLREALR
jgi:hypothetical protein